MIYENFYKECLYSKVCIACSLQLCLFFRCWLILLLPDQKTLNILSDSLTNKPKREVQI